MDPNPNAAPTDRHKTDLYVHEIEADHRVSRDGTLVEAQRITLGKMGVNIGQFANHYWADRMEKENTFLWEALVRDVYARWKKTQTITTDGFPLESWHLTKGMLKRCKELGLHSVEDIATAGGAVSDRLGMGGVDIVARAKAFVANKDQTALANKMTILEAQLDQMAKDIAERDATIAQLASGQPKPQRQRAA